MLFHILALPEGFHCESAISSTPKNCLLGLVPEVRLEY